MAPDRASRRLAAILSADAVGYGRLMSADDVGTVHHMAESRRLIGDQVGQHAGRVVDAPGDNLLAEFASAVDAVECAVEIQRLLAEHNAELPEARRMPFRIGVNLGDVVAEGERIHGDGVNVAARLEGLAEPGGICVSASVCEQVRARIGVAFEDLGAHSLKNIADPVRVFRVAGIGSAEARVRSRRGRLLAGAVLATAIGIALAVGWPDALDGLRAPGSQPLPNRPSLAVLPFANLSDPDQEWIADGITEDLTTDLSRHTMLFVIASSSAFSYKGRAVDVEAVGRELGVRYLVEGSVRRAGERIRVTAQPIDAASGFHRWSERYDRKLADVFSVQAELAERIMDAVGVEVQAAEAERLRRVPTQDLSAYESYLRAHWHFSAMTRSSHAQAALLLERALALDPEFAAARAMLGQIHLTRWILAWSRDPAELERARALTQRALELDPEQAHAHVTLAQIALLAGHLGEAETAARRALGIDPNRPGAHFTVAMLRAREGRSEAAAQAVQRFLRVNPRAGPAQSGAVAWIHYLGGRHADAARLWERALEARPEMAPAVWPLVHLRESEGRTARARELVEAILAVNPALTTEALLAGGELPSDQHAAHRASLRAAGMP